MARQWRLDLRNGTYRDKGSSRDRGRLAADRAVLDLSGDHHRSERAPAARGTGLLPDRRGQRIGRAAEVRPSAASAIAGGAGVGPAAAADASVDAGTATVRSGEAGAGPAFDVAGPGAYDRTEHGTIPSGRAGLDHSGEAIPPSRQPGAGSAVGCRPADSLGPSTTVGSAGHIDSGRPGCSRAAAMGRGDSGRTLETASAERPGSDPTMGVRTGRSECSWSGSGA
jgi:hypothetical protein